MAGWTPDDLTEQAAIHGVDRELVLLLDAARRQEAPEADQPEACEPVAGWIETQRRFGRRALDRW